MGPFQGDFDTFRSNGMRRYGDPLAASQVRPQNSRVRVLELPIVYREQHIIPGGVGCLGCRNGPARGALERAGLSGRSNAAGMGG
jgi:hypothetical protein